MVHQIYIIFEKDFYYLIEILILFDQNKISHVP